MKKNTADTAAQIQRAAASLDNVAKAQAESLDRLNEMSGTLINSLKTNSAMAGAIRKQLNIQQQEQADRAAQLAKKPDLHLSIGSKALGPWVPDTLYPTASLIRDETDTSMTLNSSLGNLGMARATNVELIVAVVGTDVSVSATAKAVQANEPRDKLTQVTLINFKLIRTNQSIPATLTITFPKGSAPFLVLFFADADQIDRAISLGSITLTPRTPRN